MAPRTPTKSSRGDAPDPSDVWIRLGVIGRPHGIRGALKLHLDNPDSETLRAGLEVRLVVGNAAPRLITIEKLQPGIVTLRGLADRTAAEALRHAVVEVRRSDFVDVDDDDDGVDAFLVDLIGAPVRTVDGVALGTILGFTDNVAQTLAEVRPLGKGPSVLVPFVPPIVHGIDDDGVVLAPPPGLFDDDALVAGSAHEADTRAADDDGDDDDDADDADADDGVDD